MKEEMLSQRGAIDEVLPAVLEGLRGQLRTILSCHRIPPQDAEDLVQTALLALVARWDDVHDPSAWLCGTLRRCCLRYWRERRLQAQRFLELDGLSLELGSGAQCARGDLLIDLDRGLAQLPPRHRQLLLLRYRLGLGPGEAARATGFASRSVQQTIRRSLARLRAALHETAPAGDGRLGAASGEADEPAPAAAGAVRIEAVAPEEAAHGARHWPASPRMAARV
jgi:RNA polymerase sigma factor (sigma-70 family)